VRKTYDRVRRTGDLKTANAVFLFTRRYASAAYAVRGSGFPPSVCLSVLRKPVIYKNG